MKIYPFLYYCGNIYLEYGREIVCGVIFYHISNSIVGEEFDSMKEEMLEKHFVL